MRAFIIAVIVVALGVGMARAATPTPTPGTPSPTPTLLPSITPMPTWNWPTYTPLPPGGSAPALNMPDINAGFADGAGRAVQMWQSGNSTGVIDTIQGAVFIVLLLGLLASTIKAWKDV